MSLAWTLVRGGATALGAAEVVVHAVVGLAFVLGGAMGLAWAFLFLAFAQVAVVVGLWQRNPRARPWAVVVFGAALGVVVAVDLTPLYSLESADLTPLAVINATLLVYAVSAVVRAELWLPAPSRG